MKEWKSYVKDSSAEGNGLLLPAVLWKGNLSPELCVMPCLGVMEDNLHSRFAIIYRPPSYIENHRAFSEDKRRIICSCLPSTLSELLESGSSTMLPLGERFVLARKLTRSLYLIHAAGFVHEK